MTFSNPRNNARNPRPRSVFAESQTPANTEVRALRHKSVAANPTQACSSSSKKRCRTMRHESVEFNNIGYQIHMLITALVAYHNRTGADMTEWFGLHELPTKWKRHLALAA